MLFSDGRVSENTTTLIRRLLVLEPSQRMTAAEVLDSLSVNIATTKSLLAPLEPLQVNTVLSIILISKIWWTQYFSYQSSKCVIFLNYFTTQHFRLPLKISGEGLISFILPPGFAPNSDHYCTGSTYSIYFCLNWFY